MKAPFSWPKSSLSIRLGGRAVQLTTTNGPSDLGFPNCFRQPCDGANPSTGSQQSIKLVAAIINPVTLDDVREALSEIGVTGITVIEVKGFAPARLRSPRRSRGPY